jgi:hypothetical protein
MGPARLLGHRDEGDAVVGGGGSGLGGLCDRAAKGDRLDAAVGAAGDDLGSRARRAGPEPEEEVTRHAEDTVGRLGDGDVVDDRVRPLRSCRAGGVWVDDLGDPAPETRDDLAQGEAPGAR